MRMHSAREVVDKQKGGPGPAPLEAPNLNAMLRSYAAHRSQSVHGAKVFARWQVVIKIALHLPVLQIEVAVRSAVETNAVRLAVSGERAAHLCVPAANQSVQPAS